MQKLIRPIASLFVLAVFLLIALATGGTSNTTVNPGDCDVLDEPADHDNLIVNIQVKYKNGDPAPNQYGLMYFTRQEIVDTLDCTFLITALGTGDFHTDDEGKYILTQHDAYTNYNSGDLYRVEVDLLGVRYLEVAAGYSNICIFTITLPTPL